MTIALESGAEFLHEIQTSYESDMVVESEFHPDVKNALDEIDKVFDEELDHLDTVFDSPELREVEKELDTIPGGKRGGGSDNQLYYYWNGS